MSTPVINSLCFYTVGFLCFAGQPACADWLQFRGNNSSGIGTGSPPVEFGPGKNEQWKTQLKPASNSPCCDSQNVIAYFGSFGLVCYDHQGNQQWEKELPLAD